MSLSVHNMPIDARVIPANVDRWQAAYAWGNHADAGYALSSALILHEARTDNPHQVTAAQVGALAVDAQAVDAARLGGELPAYYERALGFTPEDAANKSADGTFAANSDTLYPSQKAVKTYADQLINAANALVYKGTLDCSANPDYPAAESGWMYVVSVAGKVGGAEGGAVEAGDMVLCLTDSAGGSQAVAGTAFNIIEKNIEGYILGPATAADGGFVAFDGVTGKLVKDSGYTPASFDAAGVAAGLMSTHESAFTHADILHANRAYLDGIDQALGTGASAVFAGLTVDTSTIFVDAANHRLGVRNATPLTALDIAGELRIKTMPGAGNIKTPNNTRVAIQVLDDGNAFYGIATFKDSGGAEKARLLGTGLLGINTASPSAMLHAVSNATNKPAIIAQAIADMTANVFEARNPAGVAGAYIDQYGNFTTVGSINTSTITDSTGYSNAQIKFGGASKYIALQTNAVKRWQITSDGHLACMGSDWGLSLADPSIDGAWRIIQSGDNIAVQKRESGAWVTKSLAAPSLYTITMSGTNIPIDWNNGKVQKVQLLSGANTLLLPTNPVAGTSYRITLMQPTSGAAGTVDFAALPIRWYYGGTSPELTATNSYCDTIQLTWDGTVYGGEYVLGRLTN